MFLRLEQLSQVDVPENKDRVRDILIFMVPWIRNLNLHLSEEHTMKPIGGLVGASGSENYGLQNMFLTSYGQSLARAQAILNNLFCLTVHYGDDYVTEIENIWVQMFEAAIESTGETHSKNMLDVSTNSRSRAEEHTEMIIDYLIFVGLWLRNPKVVIYTKKIVVYLSRTESCPILIRALTNRITPRNLVPIDTAKLPPPSNTSASKDSDLYQIDITRYLPEMPTRPAFSIAGLSVIFLGDMVVEVGSILESEHLALILHVIFIQLDHFISLVCEQMRLLLINIIQILIPRRLATIQFDELSTRLILKEGRRLWPYEDITPQTRHIASVDQLGDMIERTKYLIAIIDPNISQLWGDISLAFAVGCPVRHAACRSLQVYRALQPSFTQRTLCELLYRLSTTISDDTEEIRGFSLELLFTLDKMANTLDGEQLLKYPQFFWVCVACLHSPHEWEYLEALMMLKKVIEKIDIGNPTVVNILLINFPAKWRGTFTGVQPLLLRGLLSSKAEATSLEVLNSLLTVENDLLVDKNPSRLLFAVLANLPRLLQGFSAEPLSDGAEEVNLSLESCLLTAGKLSELALLHGKPSLSRLLQSYSRQRFRSKEDFSRQFVYIMRDTFFPAQESATIQFLISLLSNPLPFYKRRTLIFMRLMLPILNEKPFGMKEADTSKVRGIHTISAAVLEEEFIQPLIDLLSGDMGEVAAEVLDEILKATLELPEESNLRYVFGGKSVFRLTREAVAKYENERGIGEGSKEGDRKALEIGTTGWKAKDPTKATKVTRYNIAGVAGTCSTIPSKIQQKALHPEVLDNVLTPTPTQLSNSPLRNFIAVDPTFSPNTSIILPGEPTKDDSKLKPKIQSLKLIEQLDELDAFFDDDDANSDDGEEVNARVVEGVTMAKTPSDLAVNGMESATISASNTEFEHPRRNSLVSTSSDFSYSAEDFETTDMPKPSAENATAYAKESYPMHVLSDDEEDDAEYTRSPPEFIEDEDLDQSTDSIGAPEQHESPVENASMSASMDATLSKLNAGARSNTVSAARRLLCQDSTYVSLILRLLTPYNSVVSDLRFSVVLSSDIARALNIDKSRIIVDLLEPDDVQGTKATVRFKGSLAFGNGQENVEAMAYAEELMALIIGDDEDAALHERNVLLSGLVTSQLDTTFKPEISISK
jgi:hypothetical protein